MQHSRIDYLVLSNSAFRSLSMQALNKNSHIDMYDRKVSKASRRHPFAVVQTLGVLHSFQSSISVWEHLALKPTSEIMQRVSYNISNEFIIRPFYISLHLFTCIRLVVTDIILILLYIQWKLYDCTSYIPCFPKT